MLQGIALVTPVLSIYVSNRGNPAFQGGVTEAEKRSLGRPQLI